MNFGRMEVEYKYQVASLKNDDFVILLISVKMIK